MWLRWHTVLPGLVAIGLLSGCGSGGEGDDDDYTLRVEVTSSGLPLAFTGTVTPNKEPKVPISGTTPFALNIHDRKDTNCPNFGPPCVTRANVTVTKVTKNADVLMVCLANGDRRCTSTTAISPDTAFVTLSF